MKKILSIFLVLSMLAASMASCGETATEDTTGDTSAPAAEDTTPAAEDTTPAAEDTAAPETSAPAAETEAPAVEEVANEGYIFDQMSEWHALAHECTWIDADGTVRGSAGVLEGHYDNDQFAEFVAANPEWYKDYDLMSKWEVYEGPFGTGIDQFIAAETGWATELDTMQGLTVYKTFEITDLSDTTLYEFYCFYDNSVHMYLNGVEFFVMDGSAQEGDGSGKNDWNGGYNLITPNVDPEKTSIKDYLVEGTNHIAVSLRDKWGGREFDAQLWYQLNSTKRDVTVLSTESTWNAKAFECPYTDGDGVIDGGAANGFFDEATDEFKKFITENPGFTTDYATLESWPTFKAVLNDGTADLGWVGSTHGLIAHTTFELTADQIADLKTCDEWRAYGSYDNAIHMYLNGVEIYQNDGECVVQDWASGEWNLVDYREALEGALVEGTNHIVVTIKDAWGGRNMNMGLYCHWN